MEWIEKSHRQGCEQAGANPGFQNPELAEKLLATGDAVLAECSESDRIWGIGLGLEDAAAEEPAQWRGQNLMGFTLMAVRDVLRKNFTIE